MSVNPGFGGQRFLPAQPRQDRGACARRSRRAASRRRSRSTAASTPATRARWWRPAPRSWWPAPRSSASGDPEAAARAAARGLPVSRALRVSTVRVRYAETDQMGVAYHGNYFAWFEVGRTDLLRDLGFTYRELEADGLRLPVIETQARFLRPALYDDMLEIRTEAGGLRGARMRFDYEVHREGTAGPLATGSTEHAAVDPQGRPRRLPEADLRTAGWREGGGDRRRRLHRLAARRAPARRRPRGRRHRRLRRLLPARGQGGEPAARARGARASARRGRAPGAGPRAAPGRGGPGLPPGRPGRRARLLGTRLRPSTRTTTCSPRSACSRRRSQRGAAAPRVRVLVFGLRRRCERCRCARTRACRPVSPYGVTKLAAEHLVPPLRPEPRPAGGEPALLHGLRTAAAAGHGLPPLPARPRATAGRSIVYGDGRQTRDFTFVDDIVAATRAAADTGRPGMRLQRRRRRAGRAERRAAN